MSVWVDAMEVTNRKGNHNKFYRVYVYENDEVRVWGRIGTQGQQQIFRHPNESAARRSAEDKIEEKLNKGYSGLVRRSFGTLTDDPPTTEWLRVGWHTASPENRSHTVGQRLFWETA